MKFRICCCNNKSCDKEIIYFIVKRQSYNNLKVNYNIPKIYSMLLCCTHMNDVHINIREHCPIKNMVEFYISIICTYIHAYIYIYIYTPDDALHACRFAKTWVKINNSGRFIKQQIKNIYGYIVIYNCVCVYIYITICRRKASIFFQILVWVKILKNIRKLVERYGK